MKFKTLCYLVVGRNKNTALTIYIILITNYFLKPFLKGKILRSSERGVNSILTTSLRFWPTSWRDRIFRLVASDSARRKDHFQKKICPKRTFPSNFVKLVSKILYLFLAEKMVVCCLFVCLLFVVVAIFCPILAYFFLKLKHSSSWERCF